MNAFYTDFAEKPPATNRPASLRRILIKAVSCVNLIRVFSVICVIRDSGDGIAEPKTKVNLIVKIFLFA